MIKIILIILITLCTGCVSNQLTVDRTGDGTVWPFVGTQTIGGSGILTVIAAEKYRSNRWDRWEAGPDCSVYKNGSFYCIDVPMNKNQNVCAIFASRTDNKQWLQGTYTVQTRYQVARDEGYKEYDRNGNLLKELRDDDNVNRQ